MAATAVRTGPAASRRVRSVAGGRRVAGGEVPERAARSAPDSRERLLQAGIAFARRAGLRALTVRGVAQQAGVNLGSFVYHFGTRDAFVAELIEHWYAPFYAALQSAPAAAEAPLARLRRLLREVIAFVIPNQALIAHVLMDAAAGEVAARRFVGSLAGRHPQLILRAVAEAQAAGAVRRDAPPLQQTLYLIAATGAPVLMTGAALRSKLLPRDVAALLAPLATDVEAAAQRIDWALRGIAVEAS